MAYNREIDEAISFLNENKQILQEHDLFEDAKGAIHEIQNVILKEQK